MMKKEISKKCNPSTIVAAPTTNSFRKKVKDWWSEKKKFFSKKAPQVNYMLAKVNSGMNNISNDLSRGLRRLLFISLLLMIVMSLNPEFANKFPVLSDMSEGVVSLFEWSYKALFGIVRALVSYITGDIGDASSILGSIWDEFIGLFQTLWNWIQSIQF